MKGFNRVIIAGNLTRDPELKYTVNQRAYARFGVAVNGNYKNQSGETQERVDYFNVIAWTALAEAAAKYLRKGNPILIEGRLRNDNYEKDGVKHYRIDIVAENLVFLNAASGSSNGNYNSQPQSQPQVRGNNPNPGDVYISPMPGGDFGEFDNDNFAGDFSRGFDDLNSGFGGFDPKNNDMNNNNGDSENDLPF